MRRAEVAKIPVYESSGDVFIDIGFTPAEAEELNVKSALISAINDTIRKRKLTQVQAAKLCSTDQPTLSKIMRGRVENVTIDRLAGFLTALGRSVEIRIKPYNARVKTGRLLAIG